jgi:hypothetical protein
MTVFAWIRIVLLLLAVGNFCLSLRAEEQATDSRITLRTLLIFQKQLFSAQDDTSKAKIGRDILKAGDLLSRGAFKPATAAVIVHALRSGAETPEELKPYRPFWMLRAIAAVHADDKKAGEQAAAVLKKLGPPTPENSSYIDVLAAINVKGWLTKSTNRSAGTSDEPEVSQESRSKSSSTKPSPKTRATDVGHEYTYQGNVGRTAATFRLRLEDDGRVTGTYSQDGKTYRLEGNNSQETMMLFEYTGEQMTARLDLRLRNSDTEIQWEGTMYNIFPNNNTYPVLFSRSRQ